MPDAMSQFAFWNGRNLIHHKPRDRGKSVLIVWLDHYSKERRFTLVACDDTDRNRFYAKKTDYEEFLAFG